MVHFHFFLKNVPDLLVNAEMRHKMTVMTSFDFLQGHVPVMFYLSNQSATVKFQSIPRILFWGTAFKDIFVTLKILNKGLIYLHM